MVMFGFAFRSPATIGKEDDEVEKDVEKFACVA